MNGRDIDPVHRGATFIYLYIFDYFILENDILAKLLKYVFLTLKKL